MRSAVIIAAAALVVGGINLASAHAASDGPAVSPTQMQTSPTPVAQASHTAPDSQIRGAIAQATECAMTPNDMTNLVSQFPHAQQQRIAKSSTYSQGYGDKLNNRIESISKAWKQKYGNSFSMTNGQDIFSQSSASIQSAPGNPGKTKMESATLTIPGPSASVNLQMQLIRESNNDWRINVPDTLTAAKLRANLLAQLTDVANHSAHWPRNESDAYRSVARHVMTALLDKPIASHAQATADSNAATSVAQPTPKATVTPVAETSTHHWYQFWNWR